LKKLKDGLHRIAERSNIRAGTEDEQGELESSVEERSQQTKFTKRVASIINFIDPEAIQAYFGSTDHEEIWREMNTQEEHRDRVQLVEKPCHAGKTLPGNDR
jgi:predicted Rossmann-fold nucleotide-binding protein